MGAYGRGDVLWKGGGVEVARRSCLVRLGGGVRGWPLVMVC